MKGFRSYRNTPQVWETRRSCRMISGILPFTKAIMNLHRNVMSIVWYGLTRKACPYLQVGQRYDWAIYFYGAVKSKMCTCFSVKPCSHSTKPTLKQALFTH